MPYDQDDWTGCYNERWQGLILPDAFAHPAKFSRGLIRRIYQHARDEGWLLPGSVVVDCFGGVALGGFEAAWNGAHWIGCELEPKFVALGNRNIELWERRYGHQDRWGSVRLVQGDSRKLSEVLTEAGLCVSSPPYTGDTQIGGGGANAYGAKKHFDKTGEWLKGNLVKTAKAEPGYGSTPGNLGNLKADEAGLSLAISSPPFVESLASDSPEKRGGLFRDPKRAKDKTLTATYGIEDGQLGTMKEGDFSLAVSSPPYANSVNSGESGIDWDKAKRPERWTGNRNRNGCQAAASHEMKYGESNGQLGAMRDRGFDLSVSSPPFENSNLTTDTKFMAQVERDKRNGSRLQPGLGEYGQAKGQMGNVTGHDFWSAARQIVEETYKVLAPDAHAIWVVKAFVRKKTYVDFPDQWRQLCEAVGFKTLHWHRAMLVEEFGGQQTLTGETIVSRLERKSFFRRLAESKGSPRIDFEVVLCQVKQGSPPPDRVEAPGDLFETEP